MLSSMPVFHGQHSSTNGLFDVNFFRKWRSGQGCASERLASSSPGTGWRPPPV